ncbi:hypothetical protein L6164_033668 [Bauhinia variegata]|uniref:Uncharacterized protein n=1 Tax=Bauhinia variegata TaxID=167791 RepID=A0ACB9KSJ9_BAUVA|nr:hypothetical protein L6164_033668 [Bauhinia variegata]
MLKPWKLGTLFALVAIYPSWATGQYDRDQTSLGLATETMNDSPLSPSTYADNAFSPETQGEESMATPAYAPETGEDAYPYADNPSTSPVPADFADEQAPTPELQDNGDEDLYSPSEAPSPADAHAYAPVFPFNYSAEDDAGEFSYEEDEKINGSTIGLFVVGAVCVIGLGGLAYKKRREEKRKQYEMYQMARRGEFI